jgi:acylphosphatase
MARRLGLTGWVRNLPDGRVESFACGGAEALQSFEDWLWKGPEYARVERVAASEAPVEEMKGFAVR